MLVTETQNGYKTQRVCSVLSHSNIGEAEHQTREFTEEKKKTIVLGFSIHVKAKTRFGLPYFLIL